MKSIYTCKACRYTFCYAGKCEQCPDCGKFAVRAATKQERADYFKFQEEKNDPANIKRYVHVAFEDSYTAWFIDESDTMEVGSFVIVENSSHKEVPAEIFEVLHCNLSDPPCAGLIKPVLRPY